jgi:hypothetical protein
MFDSTKIVFILFFFFKLYITEMLWFFGAGDHG